MYSAAIPQRADMILERCTNAVATPFGVTGALAEFETHRTTRRNKQLQKSFLSCFMFKYSVLRIQFKVIVV